MDAFLELNHQRPPCKHMRAAILTRYLQDYAKCTDKKNSNDKTNSSSSSGLSRGPSSLHLAQSTKKQAITTRLISKKPVVVAPKLTTNNIPMAYKVGKNVDKQGGLFKKGRTASSYVLEQMGTKNQLIVWSYLLYYSI